MKAYIYVFHEQSVWVFLIHYEMSGRIEVGGTVCLPQ